MNIHRHATLIFYLLLMQHLPYIHHLCESFTTFTNSRHGLIHFLPSVQNFQADKYFLITNIGEPSSHNKNLCVSRSLLRTLGELCTCMVSSEHRTGGTCWTPVKQDKLPSLRHPLAYPRVIVVSKGVSHTFRP